MLCTSRWCCWTLTCRAFSQGTLSKLVPKDLWGLDASYFTITQADWRCILTQIPVKWLFFFGQTGHQCSDFGGIAGMCCFYCISTASKEILSISSTGGSMLMSAGCIFFLLLSFSQSVIIALQCLFCGTSVAAWNGIEVVTVELYPASKRYRPLGLGLGLENLCLGPQMYMLKIKCTNSSSDKYVAQRRFSCVLLR